MNNLKLKKSAQVYLLQLHFIIKIFFVKNKLKGFIIKSLQNGI